MKKILFLGLSDAVLADAQQQLAHPHLVIFRGTNVEAARAVLAEHAIDHVFMGGGLPTQPALQTELVLTIFKASSTTNVHMLNTSVGPPGFVPFVRAVLRGFLE